MIRSLFQGILKEFNLVLKKNHIVGYLPMALILFNLVLKFLFINNNPIAGDEPFSIYHGLTNVKSIIDLMKLENNPPVHFIILHYWIKLFGISAFSVRFLSVIFSTLIVWVLFEIGKRFLSIRIGVTASLLYSFSNLNLLLAHEARVYSLFGLLTVVSMYFFLAICNKKMALSYFILLFITNCLLVYSHYFGSFVIAVQAIAVFIIKDIRKSIFKPYLVYTLILICSFIPIILTMINRFSGAMPGTWVEKPNGLASLYDMLWSFSNQPVTTVFCITILILLSIKLIFRKKQIPFSLNEKVIVLWFAFPFFFMFGISYKMPMYLDRYLIFVSTAYYLTIAIAISHFFEKALYKNIISAVFVLFFLFTFNPNKSNKSRVVEIVNKVKELKDENTTVVICDHYYMLNFAYYYDKNIFCSIDNGNQYGEMLNKLNDEKIYPVNTADNIPYGTDNFIFIDAGANSAYPDNHIADSLNKRFVLKQKFVYHDNLKLFVYEKQSQ
jgi:mannosyltransferase